MDDCSGRVQTSDFLSATVLSCRESSSRRRSGRDADKTVLSCLAWRCELAGSLAVSSHLAMSAICIVSVLYTAVGRQMLPSRTVVSVKSALSRGMISTPSLRYTYHVPLVHTGLHPVDRFIRFCTTRPRVSSHLVTSDTDDGRTSFAVVRKARPGDKSFSISLTVNFVVLGLTSNRLNRRWRTVH